MDEHSFDLPLDGNTGNENKSALLKVFFILDSSGSMTGARISALNDAMNTTLDALRDINKGFGECEIQVCILEFNTNWRWITKDANGNPVAEPVENVKFRDLAASGQTHLGAALKELDHQLSSTGLMKMGVPHYMPIFIFVTDGEPNDNWESGVDLIKGNKWYKRDEAIKFVIYIHDVRDRSEKAIKVFEKLVGDKREHVIEPQDTETFKTMIKKVAVSSSLLIEKTHNIGGGQNDIEKIAEGITGKPVTVLPHKPEKPVTKKDEFENW